MLIIESKTISELLGKEYSRRKQSNVSYSMRAFARDLKLSPSRLSEVLKGDEGLSGAATEGIAEALGKSSVEKKFIKDLVLAEFSRSAKVRELANIRLQDARTVESLRRLQEDQFRVISDWYHGAILELIQLDDFQNDVQWISQRLGISPSAASSGMARLEKLGMIHLDQSGRWRAQNDGYSAISGVPSQAIRKFHLQVLAMHAESLREDSMHDRQFLSTFLAIPKSRLGEFQYEMTKFVTQFIKNIEADRKDDLYSLSLQLCPVRNRRPERRPAND